MAIKAKTVMSPRTTDLLLVAEGLRDTRPAAVFDDFDPAQVDRGDRHAAMVEEVRYLFD